MYGAIFPRLWKRAKREYGERDVQIRQACGFFRDEDNLKQLMVGKPYDGVDLLEEYLDIPSKFRDPCRYSLCVEELRQLDQPLNMHPRQFLDTLLETIICIQLTINTQTQAGLEQRQKMLNLNQTNYTVSFGADDMLPIFICVLVQSDLKNAATSCSIMEHSCDPTLLNDEYGYYLTCFQSAIDFVENKWNDIMSGQ